MRRMITAITCAAAALLLAAAPGADAGTPGGLPADPSAGGYIGLCDEAGHNITGGSITTKPFVWKAVASTHPPAAYQGAGQNAVLNIYQPRPGTLPSDWSGQSLTAAGFYADKAQPTSQATYADESLQDFMTQFPPLDNGLYVLRMFYGKMNYGLYSAVYPTTTIQVVGTKWRVIAGGTVDCRTATAKSNEALAGVVSKRDTIPRAPAAGQVTAATSPTTSTSTATAGASSNGGRAASGAARAASGTGPISQAPVDVSKPGAAASASHHSSGSLPWVWLLVPLALLLALGAVVLHRRATASTPSE